MRGNAKGHEIQYSDSILRKVRTETLIHKGGHCDWSSTQFQFITRRKKETDYLFIGVFKTFLCCLSTLSVVNIKPPT